MDALPTQEEMLTILGPAGTSKLVERLRRLVFTSPKHLEVLAHDALTEKWGEENFVLEKYLAAHLPWAIEQGKITKSGNQIYVSAGSLQTRYGTPLYVVLEKNRMEGRQPLAVAYVGSQVSAPALPTPPTIPSPPTLPKGAEVIMMHDHILGDNTERVLFLKDTPPVAQMCAIGGAIQWSMNRSLHFPYYYFGKMNYLVPLYLTSRENITLAPDLVAPVEVMEETLFVRTVLQADFPYPNARIAVKRHDQLPPWLLDSWNSKPGRSPKLDLDEPTSSASV